MGEYILLNPREGLQPLTGLLVNFYFFNRNNISTLPPEIFMADQNERKMEVFTCQGFGCWLLFAAVT